MALAAAASVWATDAPAQDSAADILADQIRLQGFTCRTPTKATRDAAASRPDEAVWVLTCEDGLTYRIRLVPDQAAKVDKIAG